MTEPVEEHVESRQPLTVGERAVARTIDEELLEQPAPAGTADGVAVRPLVGRHDEAVGSRVEGEHRHADVAVVDDVAHQVTGRGQVGPHAWPAREETEVVPEFEVRLPVERQDEVPVHGAGEQALVVHADVPRRVAAGALLHLGAEAEDERELELERLELLFLTPA